MSDEPCCSNLGTHQARPVFGWDPAFLGLSVDLDRRVLSLMAARGCFPPGVDGSSWVPISLQSRCLSSWRGVHGVVSVPEKHPCPMLLSGAIVWSPGTAWAT